MSNNVITLYKTTNSFNEAQMERPLVELFSIA